MTTGKRIKKLRGEKSLADFGAELGVSGQQISKIEHGNSAPSIDLATKICELYGVTMDWLIRGIGPENISISQEPAVGYVSISKDEYIDLLKSKLHKTEQKQEDAEKSNESLKNDQGIVSKP